MTSNSRADAVFRSTIRKATVGISALVAGCSSAGEEPKRQPEIVGATHQAVSNHNVQVGVRCEQAFSYDWQPPIVPSNGRCTNFLNTMSENEEVGFYYNLRGANWALEEPDTCGWPCGNADSVDFFFMSTHGYTQPNWTFSEWAMWDIGKWALTSNMRLGNSGRQNMVLATFACDTHATDSTTWNRWIQPFAGGMVVTVGGHGNLYDGETQQGTEYAQRLTYNTEPIGYAWLESVWYADNNNTPTAINTGANQSDCWVRSNTTLDTLFSAPILRDGAIGYMCWSSWN